MLFYEKAFYFCLIGRSDEYGIIQIAFLLRRLFGEDMAMVSVFPLDFSGAGEVEALLGSGICFHLWHFDKL